LLNKNVFLRENPTTIDLTIAKAAFAKKCKKIDVEKNTFLVLLKVLNFFGGKKVDFFPFRMPRIFSRYKFESDAYA
jgi:hypothetical protein